jgi:hypothetical protein
MITTRWSDVACTKIISGEKINPTMDATRPTFTTYCSKPLVTTTAVKQVVSSQQSAGHTYRHTEATSEASHRPIASSVDAFSGVHSNECG